MSGLALRGQGTTGRANGTGSSTDGEAREAVKQAAALFQNKVSSPCPCPTPVGLGHR